MDVNLEHYTKSHSIYVKKKINASKKDIWQLISKPSNLELFHPFCKSNKTIKWPGVGSSDELIYLNNFKLIDKFLKLYNKSSIFYITDIIKLKYDSYINLNTDLHTTLYSLLIELHKNIKK